MSRISIAASLLTLLILSSCANTIHGMAQDAKDTGQAMDSSTKRVLKASN